MDIGGVLPNRGISIKRYSNNLFKVWIGTVEILGVSTKDRAEKVQQQLLKAIADFESKNPGLTIEGMNIDYIMNNYVKIGTFNGYRVLYIGDSPTKDNYVITLLNEKEIGNAREVWIKRIATAMKMQNGFPKDRSNPAVPIVAPPPSAPPVVQPLESNGTLTATSNADGQVLINGKLAIGFNGKKRADRAAVVVGRINEIPPGSVDIDKFSLEIDKSTGYYAVMYDKKIIVRVMPNDYDPNSSSFDQGIVWLKKITSALGIEKDRIVSRVQAVRKDRYKDFDEVAEKFIRVVLKEQKLASRVSDGQIKKIIECVKKYSEQFNIDPYVLLGLIAKESNFWPANHNANCFGLTQIKLIFDGKWCSRLGVNHSNWHQIDPSVKAGAQYLSQMCYGDGGNVRAFDNYSDALGAYNWGPQNMRDYLNGFITYFPSETRNYRTTILAGVELLKQGKINEAAKAILQY